MTPVAVHAAPSVASSAAKGKAAQASPEPEAASAGAAAPAEKAPTILPTREDGPPQLTGGQDINWGRQITVTIVWLLVICGAAWAVLRLFYQRSGMLGMGMGRRRLMRVLDRHILSPQKSILILEVGSKILVVGVADQAMTTLAELDPEDLPAIASQPADIARPAVEAAPPAAGTEAFQDQLTSLFGRRNPPA